jgi:uncharacterized membrane protein YkgB
MNRIFHSYYFKISKQMEKHSVDLMRYALALVYIWFGTLKLTGMSSAGELVEKTAFWFKPDIFIPLLGFVEVGIGIGFLFKKLIPVATILLLFHMAATFFPLFILPKICFDAFPYCPTLVGQYIIKNLVLVCGALCIAGKYNEQYYSSLLLVKQKN